MKNFLLFLIIFTVVFAFSWPRLLANSNFKFYPAISEADQNKIYLEARQSDNNLVELKIMGKNIWQPILGLAFDLTYNSEVLSYERYGTGSFLEKGGKPIYLVSLDKSDLAKMVIGTSLKRGDELPEGSGHFLSLFFRAKQSGQSNFAFNNVSLVSLDIKKRPITGVSWVGGAVELNRPPINSWKADIIGITNFDRRLVFDILLLMTIGFLLGKKYLFKKISK